MSTRGRIRHFPEMLLLVALIGCGSDPVTTSHESPVTGTWEATAAVPDSVALSLHLTETDGRVSGRLAVTLLGPGVTATTGSVVGDWDPPRLALYLDGDRDTCPLAGTVQNDTWVASDPCPDSNALVDVTFRRVSRSP